MNIFTRLSNGWTIALNSFSVLKENRQLILFPILSGLSMILIITSFVLALFATSGWDIEALRDRGTVVNYVTLFLYYVVNYFIVVFFNTALIHCTHLYFQGEKPTIGQGLRFSLQRIGVIFSWAVFAATVGMILRLIQERLGSIGKIITGAIGIVWSIATFFVVPVIAYENLGPLAAFKRSATLMKEKWGESIGATFSFGIIQLLGVVLLAIPSLALGWLIHPLVGVALFILGFFAITVIMSAAKVIFVSAVYHQINGDPVKHFNQQLADNLFVEK
ncbi:MAG TPA: DUF6159 family protein [Puia sp.]|jgi:hypothetical protein|nr:DUF6159 family protein [Puia sp.]